MYRPRERRAGKARGGWRQRRWSANWRRGAIEGCRTLSKVVLNYDMRKSLSPRKGWCVGVFIDLQLKCATELCCDLVRYWYHHRVKIDVDRPHGGPTSNSSVFWCQHFARLVGFRSFQFSFFGLEKGDDCRAMYKRYSKLAYRLRPEFVCLEYILTNVLAEKSFISSS